MSFLAGDGEMAKRIREFDWSSHPFGPPDSWPQSLRSALGICLNSSFPTAIYWGRELRLLYNDAWSTIPGPRHPACLGEPAEKIWSDIWHVIEPQFTQVIETGSGFFVDDQLLPMRRYGFEEETYWSYSFTPIRGEDGRIEGIFNSGQETTAKVLKQRQTTFLLQLTDSVRAGGNVADVMEVHCRMLGEYLGAIRVGVREVQARKGQLAIIAEWAAEGYEPAATTVPWQGLGWIADKLQSGGIVRISDTRDGDDAGLKALDRLGARSALAIPFFRAGELRAVIFVHRAGTLPWTDEDVHVCEEVLSRVIRSQEEEQSRERERTLMLEIDHRARNLSSIIQALIRMVKADDVESFRSSLLRRIGSLNNTLGILSASKWTGADFTELLRSELAPYISDDNGRVVLRGEEVLLASDNAQPIGLALHELATNAAKYGALAGPDGRLEVVWNVNPEGVLVVDWRERHINAGASLDVSSSGFGTLLLTTTIEGQLGGSLTRVLEDGNLDCRLEIPLTRNREAC